MVKRLQTNNDLDEEYFQIINEKGKRGRMDEIQIEREENAKIVGRLLEQLEI